MKINIQITSGEDVPIATAKEVKNGKFEQWLAAMMPALSLQISNIIEAMRGKFWRPNGVPPSSDAAGTTRPNA